MKSLSLIGSVLFLFSSQAWADLEVKMHFSPIANLVYQLDCVSETIKHCSRHAYEDLWHSEFLKNAEDQKQIDNWSELANRYNSSVDLESEESYAKTGRVDAIQLSTKLRIASFQSASIEEYFNRLDLVVIPKDRQKFEAVIRYFYPRFEKWWSKTAEPTGKTFTKEMGALLVRPDILKKLKDYAHFYQAALPQEFEIHFNLFYRPDFKEPTRGQQIENYSVSEFLPSEKPVDRVDVIIHELCHFYYGISSDEAFVKFRASFKNLHKAEALGAYNLFNESIATALGNGMINKLNMAPMQWQKYLAKPLSFYNDYYIDRAAKATMPWLEEWLTENKTIFDPQFVEKYVSTLKETFGTALAAPKLLLNELVFVGDGRFEKRFRAEINKAIGSTSLHSSEGDWDDDRTLKSYKAHQDLNALFIIHPKSLDLLKDEGILSEDQFKEFKTELKDKGRIIYSFEKKSGATTFIISAPSFEECLTKLNLLVGMKTGFTGVFAQ